MAMMSRLNVTPTGAQAYQSPFSVGAAPGLAPIDTMGFGDLLKQQMQQRMRMARLQQQMMRQQLDDAKRRAGRAPGLSEFDVWKKKQSYLENQRRRKAAQDYAAGAEFAKIQSAPYSAANAWHGGQAQVQKLGGLMGIPMMHEGMMQSGLVLGNLGQQAMASGGGVDKQRMANQGVLDQLKFQTSPDWIRAQSIQQSGQAAKGGPIEKKQKIEVHPGERVLNKEEASMWDWLTTLGDPESRGRFGMELSPEEIAAGSTGIEWMMTPGSEIPMPGTAPAEAAMPAEVPGVTGIPPGTQPAPAVEPPPMGTPVNVAPLSEQTDVAFGGGTIKRRPDAPEGQTDVKTYRMHGKPETEAEKRQQIRDRVEKNRKEAEYHRARQRVLLSYFADSPEKLDDPKVKNLLSQREYLAKQYEKQADDEEKRLDAIEQKEEQQKTQKEVATIQATGRVGAAEAQAGMYTQRGQQEMMQNALDAMQEANKSFAKGDIGEDGFMTSVMTAMSPYYMQIARRNKVPIQDAIGMVHQAVQMEIDNPGQGIPILFTLLGV